jgi:preprotein translocase subunit SecG
MLEILINTVHIIVALFLILVVLVQGGNQGGVSAAFGSGSSSGVFGATGATSLLGKLTYAAAGIFMVTSITLTVLGGASGELGLADKLKQKAADKGPPPTPAAVEGVAPVAQLHPQTQALFLRPQLLMHQQQLLRQTQALILRPQQMRQQPTAPARVNRRFE